MPLIVRQRYLQQKEISATLEILLRELASQNTSTQALCTFNELSLGKSSPDRRPAKYIKDEGVTGVTVGHPCL